MHIHTILLRLFFFVASAFLTSACISQSQVIEIKDSTGLRSYAVEKGDTVLVGYDSAYILNKRIFKLYQDNYKRVQNSNPSFKRLLDEYENLISFQDSMLKEKEVYYQQVKSSFDSLVVHSTKFVDRTDVNITAINQSLSNATSQLNNIKVLLDDSLNKLKLENRRKIKWAIGGFTLGIGAASLLFLIAN